MRSSLGKLKGLSFMGRMIPAEAIDRCYGVKGARDPSVMMEATSEMAESESVTRMAGEMQSHTAVIAERDQYIYFRIKRLMDIILSFIALTLLSPLLLLTALLIKLDSPGPAIFAQERVGYDWGRRRQRRFTLYKFRSMYHNSDQRAHQEHIKECIRGQEGTKSSSHDGRLVKMTNDGRVTCVGRLLRRTSLDELPQLWNVLRGEMSLVGPRPVPFYEVAAYEPWHRKRLEATPGITGLWQIKGRGQATLDEMARLDIEYIDRQSLWLDLEILLLTIPAVISGRGAA